MCIRDSSSTGLILLSFTCFFFSIAYEREMQHLAVDHYLEDGTLKGKVKESQATAENELMRTRIVLVLIFFYSLFNHGWSIALRRTMSNIEEGIYGQKHKSAKVKPMDTMPTSEFRLQSIEEAEDEDRKSHSTLKETKTRKKGSNPSAHSLATSEMFMNVKESARELMLFSNVTKTTLDGTGTANPSLMIPIVTPKEIRRSDNEFDRIGAETGLNTSAQSSSPRKEKPHSVNFDLSNSPHSRNSSSRLIFGNAAMAVGKVPHHSSFMISKD
eukprot:TRINITY_DN28661_c0_g2_i1.p1 TRINITY_DN28661_c0_g2~~TRINITY_DN28661_c0_g2_i1.p1  ORF type:complete len:271 (+),score=17.54 TRINITY_DN28661_c0_g2_i1:64-876(+)